MVVQVGLQFVAQSQQQAEARPEAHLILEEIGKLMLVEGDSRVALLHCELKRLPASEAREVRKRKRATEVGAVREIDEPGFHDRPEAECMFPVDVRSEERRVGKECRSQSARESERKKR